MQFRSLISTAILVLLTPSLISQSRIEPHASLASRTRLSGHLTPWANPAADTGQAGEATPLHLTLLLARTSALQASFDRLLADQQDPASSSFHQWLTPTQIGDQFGPTLDDIAAITRWLSTQGLQVTAVSPSRTFLDVTATTATASAAFATTFHLYSIPGDSQPTRLAATSEPSIPTAFGRLIRSIEGLTEIPFRSFHAVRAAGATGDTLTPLSTNSSGAHYLYPGDFARIYDIVPTTSAGYDGSGIKVAIAGQSRVAASDITQFQIISGLPAKPPNTILLPTSADPGFVKGDQDESTLDVTRALTIAPGSQADLVIAALSSGGVSAAIQYEVNTLLDPILSISYGACETATNASSVQFYNTLFAQAAAQGISTFVSSGDSAAAGCATAFSAPRGTETLAMGNYLCSSSYVTCVGGTEFADAGLDSTYWAPTNRANFTSALGYIPEGAWNEPTLTGATGIVTYQIAGTGSGLSAYIPKPTWQTGTGVPADGARDIPDISFSAANHDGYFACLAYIGSGADCSKGGGVIFSGTSASAPDMAGIAALLNQRAGASQGNLNPLLYRLAATTPLAFHDATPASSSVTACSTATASLCNNSTPSKTALTGGVVGYPLQVGYDLVTGLGSLDVTNFLNAAAVPIAASTVTLTAPTTTVPAAQTLALTATVAPGASTSTPTGTIQFSSSAFTTLTVQLTGGKATATPAFTTPGTYTVTAAYSGDATFPPATSTPITVTVTAAATTTTVTLAPAFLATGQSTIFTAKVNSAAAPTPTGTVQFLSNGTAIGSRIALTNTTATSSALPFATAGTYAITAAYSGDANDLPSTSLAATLTVASPGATLTAVTTTTPSITPSGTALLSARVNGNGSQTPTGNIQFYANSTAIGPSINLINGFNFLSYSGFTLPGTYTLTASYTGDTANAPSTSAPTLLTVTKYTTIAAAFTASATAISTAQTAVLKVTLSTPTTTAPAPTGTIQLYANGTPMGSPIPIAAQNATSAALLFPAAGSYTITAAYSGDASYSPTNLNGPTIAVTLPTITLAPSPAAITLASGASTGNTSTLTVATPNGFTGSVALSCAITATPASPTNPPTCSLSSPTLTVTPATSATTVLTLSTTTPRATSSTSVLSQTNLLPHEQVFSRSGLTNSLVILSEAKNPRIALLPSGARRLHAALSFAALLVFLPFFRQTRRLRSSLIFLLLPFIAFTLSGCSTAVSGTAATTTPNPILVGTTSGAYTITVTATPAIGTPTTTTLTLNVQ